jgi:hypothetical protein
MVNPRYAGLDRYNRPYAVTAAVGRQVPDRNDVMALERPQAVMTVHSGASVLVTAATGVYQSQAQLLDLFEDVNLVHHDGTRFVRRASQRLGEYRRGLNLPKGMDLATSPGKVFSPSKGDTIAYPTVEPGVARAKLMAATAPPALPAGSRRRPTIEANAEALPINMPGRPSRALSGS